MWLQIKQDSKGLLEKALGIRPVVPGCVSASGTSWTCCGPFGDFRSLQTAAETIQDGAGSSGDTSRPRCRPKRAASSEHQAQSSRQGGRPEFVRTKWGCMEKAERGRSGPALGLCGWECRGRGMYPGAYMLCGKQDLNWATAWSTAAHWCLLQSPCFSHGRLERGLIELHANNRVRTIAPCHFNEMILLLTVTAWHGLLDLAVPGCIMEGLGR